MARSLEACSYKEQTAADNKVVAVKNLSAFFFSPYNLKCAVIALVFFLSWREIKISVWFWSSAHLQHHSWAHSQTSVNSVNRAAEVTRD